MLLEISNKGGPFLSFIEKGLLFHNKFGQKPRGENQNSFPSLNDLPK